MVLGFGGLGWAGFRFFFFNAPWGFVGYFLAIARPFLVIFWLLTNGLSIFCYFGDFSATF